MRCCGNHAEFNTFLHAFFAIYKTFVQSIKYISLNAVADIIAKCTDTVYLTHICL